MMQNETLWSNIQSNETDTSLAKKLKIMENTHTQQTANKGIRARFANE